MATVNFYLNSKVNSKGERLILMFFRYNKKQIMVSTNELIVPVNWDSKSQKASSKHLGFSNFNKWLQKMKSDALELYYQRSHLKLPLDPSTLKSEFEKLISPLPQVAVTTEKEESTSNGLLEFIENQIELLRKDKNPNTIKTYTTCYKTLLKFEKEVWKSKITFDDISVAFYLKWKEYVIENNQYCDNSINKYTGVMKLFLREAEELGLHQNFIYKSSKFNTSRTDVDSIYLTKDEIQVLLDIDLSDNTRLEKVRDLFVIGCWTGLRFSDLSNLRDENVSKNMDLIHISNIIKTGGILDIPIHPIVAKIFKKYMDSTGSYIPVSITNQRMNEYLKEIAEKAGFIEEISRVKKIGTKRTNLKPKKFSLVSCHTARRSFATNQYLDGVPIYEIMAITGHRTEKAFLTYIKIKQNQYARSLGERWKASNK
jgi:integrase